MSEFKRKVNDPLRLKLSLSDANASRFVRAFLYDQNGLVIAPGFINLTHQANGIYADNSILMPNLDQVVVKYKVFMDAFFLEPDLCYPQAVDIFEKDAFDPTAFIPKGQNVFATFANQKANVVVGANKVEAVIQTAKRVDVKAIVPKIDIEIKQNNEIEGVIND